MCLSPCQSTVVTQHHLRLLLMYQVIIRDQAGPEFQGEVTSPCRKIKEKLQLDREKL